MQRYVSSVGFAKEILIDDFANIANEVTRLASEIAGEGINVSLNPIYFLQYINEILCTILLIDLSDITRNPLPGQAEYIHEQILKLIKKYIKPLTADHELGSIQLKLGRVAVLNRNQEEIDQNISFDEMKPCENQFFLNHKEAFERLSHEFKGGEQLVRRLATIQQERICSTFPHIIKEL
ncbi:unnamed protein product [Rotaria sp. Silwood2]|nr:unnamed protein product [Rotaria sp. Silwood2]CAF2727786.1 unnamed protein product [Rotaria sp. Silwood2]CAF3137617.1 unnamed protein product [Rotaria sp. Silwood2]CAF4230007.1 unnamed protein product [Rotaria sp. Silwood2]CAF4294103.1 unnamed protein product [Rotaria sp. Silwood2]